MARRQENERDDHERDAHRSERDRNREPARLLQPPLDPDAHRGAPPAISSPISSTVGGAGIDLAGDPPLVEDDDAVGEREHLVEVLADQQHGDVELRGVAKVVVNVLDRADVETARRRGGDQHARRARELAAEHDLLQVAAGELARRDVRSRRRARRSWRIRTLRALADRSQPEERPARVVARPDTT